MEKAKITNLIFIIITILAFIILFLSFGINKVKGQSMSTTYEDGDLLITQNFFYQRNI